MSPIGVRQFTVLITIFAIRGIWSQDPCEPELADRCFTDVTANLVCQMRSWDPNCTKRNISDFCAGLNDALRCTSDIVDTDCGVREGRDKFDAWLQGLRAVYYSLCGADTSIITSVFSKPHCWSPLSFIACTQSTASIDHINDLLRTSLDLQECNRLLVATSTCNVRATSQSDFRCSPVTEQISEILHTFFSATNCGTICPKSAAVLFTSSSVLVALVLALITFLSQ